MTTSRSTRTASAQRGSSSKRQHTITPESTSRRSTSGSSSVPEPRVLAGDAGGDAVEVVRPGDDREEQHRPARRCRRRSDNATTRKTGISASRTKPIALGIVHGRSGWPASVSRRRRPRAVEARQPPEGQPRALGRVLHLLAGASAPLARGQARVRHSSAAAGAAPSSGSARLSCPRRTWTSISPAGERAPADGQPQGAAEQLGVGELLARPAPRGRRRSPRARPRAARRRAARRARAPRCPRLPRPTRWTSHGAIALGQVIPCSSAYCSTAAARIRAGPMP